MTDESGPREFFNAQRDNFARVCAQFAGAPELADALASIACDNYEKNAAIQAEGQPDPACMRGCDPCCCLQVAATAPEIFHAAHFIRVTAPAFSRHGVDLSQSLRSVQDDIAGKGQEERLASQTACPLIINGACSVYAARTLACRSHISFDREACAQAVQGCDVEVVTSAAHKTTRILVQGALQAALRDAGLAWGAYEFLGALDRALQNPDCERLWREGVDVFADLRLDDGESFDGVEPASESVNAM